MKKTKVAFIGQKGIPAVFGGIEFYVEGIIEKLPKERYDSSVYVRNWYTERELKEYKSAKLIHVSNIHNRYLDTFSHAILCSADCVFRDFDIIHYQGIGPSFFCWVPKLFGKKVVLTIHGLPQKSTKWGIFAKLFLRLSEFIGIRCADKTIAVSKDLQKYLEEKYKISVEYVPNAISSDGEILAPKIIKEKYNLNRKDYILYLGRITPEKRIEWLIKAFKAVKNDRKFMDLKLVIAGAANNPDRYETAIKESIGNDENIIFTEWVRGDEKNELLSNAFLFVLPSYMEGLSIALLEAMNHKLAVLASDIPSHREAIDNNKNGFLFSCHSFDSFVFKLKEISALDDAKLNEVGIRAYEKLKNYYYSDIVIKAIEKAYQSVLMRRRY
jgi:glycosyltransferase involved in cell wall biosynthesis